ncbi:hypothetical protein [Methanoculleus frigidifontis]|uniref:hypothetical protein n=1 Tax=Methanoculleus frigidifontis TaxID=2584085 RepID=UPI0026585EA0|nr:hypothetical protein [Methanoculleus sp. FWC-SCC1]
MHDDERRKDKARSIMQILPAAPGNAEKDVGRNNPGAAAKASSRGKDDSRTSPDTKEGMNAISAMISTNAFTAAFCIAFSSFEYTTPEYMGMGAPVHLARRRCGTDNMYICLDPFVSCGTDGSLPSPPILTSSSGQPGSLMSRMFQNHAVMQNREDLGVIDVPHTYHRIGAPLIPA